MATITTVLNNLPITARGIPSSEAVRIMNNYIRNDLKDLVYLEFPESFNEEIELKVVIPTACEAVLSSVAGNIDNGDYRYRVSFVSAYGETRAGLHNETVSVIDKTTAGQISISSLPIGDATTTARKIYRQQNGKGDWELITTISDNTTTTYTDNTAQVSVGTTAYEGIELPSNFLSVVKLQQNGMDIPLVKYPSDSGYPNAFYAWVSFEDRDGVTSQQICFPDDFPQQDVQMVYTKDIIDCDQTNTLPYPIALHQRMLSIWVSGVAFYYFSELPGEEDNMMKMQEHYTSAISEVFIGNISQ